MEVLAIAIRQEKEMKGIQIGRGNTATTCKWHDMILCIKHPKVSTQKLLEVINKFSNVAEYKINVQKSIGFLYTNNELSEREKIF